MLDTALKLSDLLEGGQQNPPDGEQPDSGGSAQPVAFVPLAEQVARDLYLSRYAFDERQPPFALHDLKRDGVTTTGALSLADAALQHSLRPIVPAEAEGMIGQRVEFAEQVRVVAAERRRQAGTYTFDDQLIRLRDALADPLHIGLQLLVGRIEIRHRKAKPHPALDGSDGADEQRDGLAPAVDGRGARFGNLGEHCGVRPGDFVGVFHLQIGRASCRERVSSPV